MTSWVSNRHRVTTKKTPTMQDITSLIPAIPTEQPGRSTGKVAGYTMFTKEYAAIRLAKATDGEGSQSEGTVMAVASGTREKTGLDEQPADVDVGDDTPSHKEAATKHPLGGFQQEAGQEWGGMTQEQKEPFHEKAREINKSQALPATPTQDFGFHEQPMVAIQ